ncbi:MAG: YjdF family protein [Anaeromicrobium sp.]|uniref:YjdF family protein n=1 Tax=Anaeromicrobium sp. TaxID=1929132 RepID=UPI0025D5D9D7|nr:YjdF family protein [Anaeromicrobium sp.]MCT4594143.1 YjdF family protein [Anaeromicrobium sp.]
MNMVKSRFNVMFEKGFWVAYLEVFHKDEYQVGRYVFGPEPTEPEVFEFIVNNDYSRVRLSRAFKEKSKKEPQRINPKRRQREVAKERNKKSPCTKAQEALKVHMEEWKRVSNKKKKEERHKEKEERYLKKQLKKKEKKKGH